MNSSRRPKPARGQAFGILNPYGDLWTHQWFDTEEEATAYLARFWRGKTIDLTGFKVIPVRVTVSALPSNRKDGSSPKPQDLSARDQ